MVIATGGEKVLKTDVIRISGAGIASATFKYYPKGMAQWARAWREDRVDHPVVEFDQPSREELKKSLLEVLNHLAEVQIPKERNLVIGVSGPTRGQRVVFCPSLPELVSVLPEIVSGLKPGSFSLANNTDLFAEAEMRQGIIARRGLKSAIIVTLGRGIGSAFVQGNQVNLGEDASGGEIGHIVVDPEGPLCECGQNGCLEQYVSGPALLRQAAEIGINVARPIQLKNIPEAKPVLKAAHEKLVDSLVFAVILFRTRNIVFAGRLVELYDLSEIKGSLHNRVPDFLKNIQVWPSFFSPVEGTLLGGGHIGLRLQGAQPLVELATRSNKSPED